MVIGECNCGSITFEIETELSDVYICHCSICRRSTGGGGIAVALVAADKFNWSKGADQITYWSKPGHDWHTNFCKSCGSPLPGENDDANMYIPVGSLTTGYENLNVAHHIWVNSKADWEVIADQGKHHAEGFEG